MKAHGIFSLSLLVFITECAESFSICRQRSVVVPSHGNLRSFQDIRTKRYTVVDNENDNLDQEVFRKEQGRKKYSAARAGGRSRVIITLQRKKNETSTILSLGQRLILPVVGLWILFQFIFGGLTSTSSNFVYYESSVHETRMYNNNGKVETSRQERIRSNIPGLMERRGTQKDILLEDKRIKDQFDREFQSIFRDISGNDLFLY
jgi:hypothetical protein